MQRSTLRTAIVTSSVAIVGGQAIMSLPARVGSVSGAYFLVSSYAFRGAQLIVAGAAMQAIAKRVR